LCSLIISDSVAVDFFCNRSTLRENISQSTMCYFYWDTEYIRFVEFGCVQCSCEVRRWWIRRASTVKVEGRQIQALNRRRLQVLLVTQSSTSVSPFQSSTLRWSAPVSAVSQRVTESTCLKVVVFRKYIHQVLLPVFARFVCWLIGQCFTSPPTQYRLSGRRFYRSKDQPTESKYWRNRIRLQWAVWNCRVGGCSSTLSVYVFNPLVWFIHLSWGVRK